MPVSQVSFPTERDSLDSLCCQLRARLDEEGNRLFDALVTKLGEQQSNPHASRQAAIRNWLATNDESLFPNKTTLIEGEVGLAPLSAPVSQVSEAENLDESNFLDLLESMFHHLRAQLDDTGIATLDFLVEELQAQLASKCLSQYTSEKILTRLFCAETICHAIYGMLVNKQESDLACLAKLVLQEISGIVSVIRDSLELTEWKPEDPLVRQMLSILAQSTIASHRLEAIRIVSQRLNEGYPDAPDLMASLMADKNQVVSQIARETLESAG